MIKTVSTNDLGNDSPNRSEKKRHTDAHKHSPDSRTRIIYEYEP